MSELEDRYAAYNALFAPPKQKGPSFLDRAMSDLSEMAHGFVPGIIEMIKAPVHDVGKTFGLAGGEYQTDDLLSSMASGIKNSPYFNMAFDLNPATMPITLLDKGPVGLFKDVVSNTQGMWEHPGYAGLDMLTAPLMAAGGAGSVVKGAGMAAKAGVPGAEAFLSATAPMAGYRALRPMEAFTPDELASGEWGRHVTFDGESVDLDQIGSDENPYIRRSRRLVPWAEPFRVELPEDEVVDESSLFGAERPVATTTPIEAPDAAETLAEAPGAAIAELRKTRPDMAAMYDRATYTTRSRNEVAALMGDKVWSAIGQYMPDDMLHSMWGKRLVRAAQKPTRSAVMATENDYNAAEGRMIKTLQALGFKDMEKIDKVLYAMQMAAASGHRITDEQFDWNRWKQDTNHPEATNLPLEAMDLTTNFSMGPDGPTPNLLDYGIHIVRNVNLNDPDGRWAPGGEVTLRQALDANDEWAISGRAERERPYNVFAVPKKVAEYERANRLVIHDIDKHLLEVVNGRNWRIEDPKDGSPTRLVSESGRHNPLLRMELDRLGADEQSVSELAELMGMARTLMASDVSAEFKADTEIIKLVKVRGAAGYEERAALLRHVARQLMDKEQVEPVASVANKYAREKGDSVRRLKSMEALTRLLIALKRLEDEGAVGYVREQVREAMVDLLNATMTGRGDFDSSNVNVDEIVDPETNKLVGVRSYREKRQERRAEIRKGVAIRTINNFAKYDPNDPKSVPTPIEPLHKQLLATYLRWSEEIGKERDPKIADQQLREKTAKYLKRIAGMNPDRNSGFGYQGFIDAVFSKNDAARLKKQFGIDADGGTAPSHMKDLQDKFHALGDAFGNPAYMKMLLDDNNMLGRTAAQFYEHDFANDPSQSSVYSSFSDRINERHGLLGSIAGQMDEASKLGEKPTLESLGIDGLQALLLGHDSRLGLLEYMLGGKRADDGSKLGMVEPDESGGLNSIEGSRLHRLFREVIRTNPLDEGAAPDQAAKLANELTAAIKRDFEDVSSLDGKQFGKDNYRPADERLKHSAPTAADIQIEAEQKFAAVKDMYAQIMAEHPEFDDAGIKKEAVRRLEAEATRVNAEWNRHVIKARELVTMKAKMSQIFHSRFRDADQGKRGNDDFSMMRDFLIQDGVRLIPRNKNSKRNTALFDMLDDMLDDDTISKLKLMRNDETGRKFIEEYVDAVRKTSKRSQAAAQRLNIEEAVDGQMTDKIRQNEMALANMLGAGNKRDGTERSFWSAEDAFYIPLKRKGTEKTQAKASVAGNRSNDPGTLHTPVQQMADYMSRVYDGKFNTDPRNMLNAYKNIMDSAMKRDMDTALRAMYGQKLTADAYKHGRDAGIIGEWNDGKDTPLVRLPSLDEQAGIRLQRNVNAFMSQVSGFIALAPSLGPVFKRVLGHYNLDSLFKQIRARDLSRRVEVPEGVDGPLPEYVVSRAALEGMLKELHETSSKFIKMMKKFNEVWKPTVLHLRPAAWIRNNYVGSAMFLSMASNPVEMVKFVRKYNKGKRDIRNKVDSVEARALQSVIGNSVELLRAHRQADVVESKHARELVGDSALMKVRRGWSKYVDMVGELNAKLADEPFRAARAFQILERDRKLLSQRLGREIGFDDAAQQLLADARYKADLIEAVLGDMVDFTGMTNFERQYVATLFPFWSWIRGSVIAIMRRMSEDPEAIFAMSQISQLGAREQEADFGSTPDFARSWVDIGLPGGQLLSTGGMNPFATPLDVAAMAAQMVPFGMSYRQFGSDNPLSSMHPIILNAVEALSGKDMYFGTPLGNDAPGTQFVKGMAQLPLTATIGQLVANETGPRATTQKSRMNTIAGQLGVPLVHPMWSAVYARAKDENQERLGYNPYIGSHPESISSYDNQYAASIPWMYR